MLAASAAFERARPWIGRRPILGLEAGATSRTPQDATDRPDWTFPCGCVPFGAGGGRGASAGAYPWSASRGPVERSED